jgi:hypothetical protein
LIEPVSKPFFTYANQLNDYTKNAGFGVLKWLIGGFFYTYIPLK